MLYLTWLAADCLQEFCWHRCSELSLYSLACCQYCLARVLRAGGLSTASDKGRDCSGTAAQAASAAILLPRPRPLPRAAFDLPLPPRPRPLVPFCLVLVTGSSISTVFSFSLLDAALLMSLSEDSTTCVLWRSFFNSWRSFSSCIFGSGAPWPAGAISHCAGDSQEARPVFIQQCEGKLMADVGRATDLWQQEASSYCSIRPHGCNAERELPRQGKVSPHSNISLNFDCIKNADHCSQSDLANTCEAPIAMEKSNDLAQGRSGSYLMWSSVWACWSISIYVHYMMIWSISGEDEGISENIPHWLSHHLQQLQWRLCPWFSTPLSHIYHYHPSRTSKMDQMQAGHWLSAQIGIVAHLRPVPLQDTAKERDCKYCCLSHFTTCTSIPPARIT